MAALLDPRYKNLDFLEIDDEKEQIIQKLRNEIGEVEVPGPEILDNPAPSQDIDSSIRSQKEYRQRRQKKIKKAVTNVVISDEVTSDAGNLISAKRTNLDTKLVGQMLFLKRNIKTMQVFAPEWDEDETDHIEID